MLIPQFLQNFTLRVFRYLLNLATGILFGLVSGPQEKLPPLREKILLQPATTLARRIRKKEIRSVDVVEAFIRRAKEVNPYINAIVDDAYDDAIEAARKVDELIASGIKTEQELEVEKPLFGVPVSIKEYIGVEGMYFANGIYSRRGVRAEQDADAVKKLKAAGAIVMVKTNVPEMSIAFDTCNNIYGTTKNPYDTRRMPGGSSGGEAALIASGCSLIGVGSDLGGSIRVPAFMTGIFGHKPTAGVIPDVGTYPPMPEGISHFLSNLGPMTRYASDLRPLMKIMATPGKIDLDAQVDLKRLTVYYCEGIYGNPLITPVRPEIKVALKKAMNHFTQKFGISCKKVEIEGLQDAFAIWVNAADEAGRPTAEKILAVGGSGSSLWLEILKWCIGLSNHTSKMLELLVVFKAILRATPETRKVYQKKLRHIKAQFNNILKENCVFLFPTQPESAPYIQEALTKIVNVPYTCIFNCLGYPVTQVPMGLFRGLPIGFQVVGNLNADNSTIAVAEELEKAFGGWVCPTTIL